MRDDTALPDPEEEAQLLERTDNGPRPGDGEQPSQEPDLFPLEVE